MIPDRDATCAWDCALPFPHEGPCSRDAAAPSAQRSPVKGEDFWIDELEYQLGRPLTPTGKNYLRTWLRAFAAHVTRQASSGGAAPSGREEHADRLANQIAAMEQASKLHAHDWRVLRQLIAESIASPAIPRPEDGPMTGALKGDVDTWRDAALCIGEQLAANGPEGYYAFSPSEWFRWCHQQLAASRGPEPAVPAEPRLYDGHTDPDCEVYRGVGAYCTCETPEQKAEAAREAAEIEAERDLASRVSGVSSEGAHFPSGSEKKENGQKVSLRCNGCAGVYRFDTTVPSPTWNAVIRAQGIPEFLCTACIVRAFALAGRSFTATLWGDDFNGLPIEVVVDSQPARDAEAIQQENNALRRQLAASSSGVSEAGLRDLADRFDMASRRMSAKTGNKDLDANRAGQVEAYFRCARELRELLPPAGSAAAPARPVQGEER